MAMDDLQIRQDIVIPGWEMWMTTSRSGGPGGQHANKTSSRVTLYWDLASTTALSEGQRERVLRKLRSHVTDEGVLQVHCDETRSQHQNRDRARERLAEMVREAVKKTKRRKRTRPPKWVDRERVKAKRRRGRLKKLRQDPPDPHD